MKRVVAYCRSACEEPGTPSSAYEQARAIGRYAKRHGLTIYETYIDPGVSGMTLKRPGLRRLLADCRAGRVRTVIMRDPERLSRDYGQLAKLLRILVEARVRFEFAAPAGEDGDAFLKGVVSVLAKLGKAKARSTQTQKRCPRRSVKEG
jgi:DNA invertase Pin-like site-specific DNA recombinase